MSSRGAQAYIAATFLVGLLCNSAAVLVTYARGAIFPDDLRAMLETLLAVYSAPLAIIVAGFFGRPASDRKPDAIVFWSAMVVSAIWNVFLLWGGVGLLAASFSQQSSESAVDDFSSYVRAISSAATFLVSGGLAYFFVKRD